jgi:hypothetical protein
MENVDSAEENERRKSVFSALLSWTEEEGTSIIVGGPGNRVVCYLILFVLSFLFMSLSLSFFESDLHFYNLIADCLLDEYFFSPERHAPTHESDHYAHGSDGGALLCSARPCADTACGAQGISFKLPLPSSSCVGLGLSRWDGRDCEYNRVLYITTDDY